MSIQAPNWYTTQYDNRVIHIYQQKGNRLRPMVTQAQRVTNEKAVWWVAGSGKAKKFVRGSEAQPMNATRSKVEATLETWQAFDNVEEFDLDRMQANEREVVYETGAMALGRATDIEIYAQMAADAPASGDNFEDQTGNDFSAVHALAMCKRLQDGIKKWDGEVFCGLPSLLWNQLLANKVVNSADYVRDLPFAKMTDTRFWNGVNWFLYVEEDAQDIYPVGAANNVDVFMWHKSGIGWGNNTDLRSIWTWDNKFTRWDVNMLTKGLAKTLQAKGIVRGRFASNGSIAIV